MEIAPAVDGLTAVRPIGVDSPETSDPTYEAQPYARQAASFAASRLTGRRVSLELDAEGVDPYGRLLAYVYLPDGRMFNEALVQEGTAQVASFPPNVRYADRFLKAQEGARAANRGLWGLTEGRLCRLTDRGNGIGADAALFLRLRLLRRRHPATGEALVPLLRRLCADPRYPAALLMRTWTAPISPFGTRRNGSTTGTRPTPTGWTATTTMGGHARVLPEERAENQR